jgi:hypothetical protein
MTKIPAGYVKALDTISGQVATVRERIATHPILGQNLVIVDEDQKPYAPGFYQPKTVEEYVETRKPRSHKDPEPEVEEPEVAEIEDTAEVSE